MEYQELATSASFVYTLINKPFTLDLLKNVNGKVMIRNGDN